MLVTLDLVLEKTVISWEKKTYTKASYIKCQID